MSHRKLLEIVFLGLLLSGSGFAQLLKYDCINNSEGGVTYIKDSKLVYIEKMKPTEIPTPSK